MSPPSGSHDCLLISIARNRPGFPCCWCHADIMAGSPGHLGAAATEVSLSGLGCLTEIGGHPSDQVPQRACYPGMTSLLSVMSPPNFQTLLNSFTYGHFPVFVDSVQQAVDPVARQPLLPPGGPCTTRDPALSLGGLYFF